MRKWLRRIVPMLAAIQLAAGALVQLHAYGADARGSREAVIRELSRTLIMDNGRIKPLETYARYTLLGISGRSTFHGKPAIEWLGRVLFTSDSAVTDSIFLINNPMVNDAVHLPQGRRFSAANLLPAIGKIESFVEPEEMIKSNSIVGFERDIFQLYYNIRSFQMISYGKAFSRQDLDQYRAFNLSFADYGLLIIPVQQNALLQWIKPASGRAGNFDRQTNRPFVSASQLSKAAKFDSASHLTIIFDSALSAYAATDFSGCADSLRSFNTQVRAILASRGIRVPVEAEIFYDRLDPFFWSRLAYFLGLIALCAGLFSSRRLWAVSGGFAVAAGLLLHTGGLVLRMIIMHRPPVASFYETFVTVAWIGVALGLLITGIMKNRYGLFIAAFMGAAFLSLASRFGADGDTLGMLAPVLNSNFWLTSHILTITAGYAGCVAAGVLGHIYLIRRLFLRQEPGRLDQLNRAMGALLAIGLTFTTIGTVLGGMWAEQAWGRFWGWDPKENGALLIIIWCAIIFHARAGGLIRQTGVAAGAVIGLALVMLAWIGVNLLGVGMHSYGFTTNGAMALIAVQGVETVFLAAALIRKMRSDKVTE